MPTTAPSPCRHKGCGRVTRLGYCEQHQRERQHQADERRGSAAARGYGSRWRRVRLQYLARNPLCVRCGDEGRAVPATVVDHIVPHRGDFGLMWAPANYQALCVSCHNAKTAQEDGGFGNRGRGGAIAGGSAL